MSAAVDIPLIDINNLTPISGSSDFGLYDNDIDYQNDYPKFARFILHRLGFPIENVELKDENVMSAYENAVSVYSMEIYNAKIADNYLSMEGSSTGSNLNNSLIQPSFANMIRIAKDYGSEVGTGGNVTYYTGSLMMTSGQQNYDLDTWASASGVVTGSDRIEIKRIFYEAPPAITRYFDPYAGTGLQTLVDTFGLGSSVPGINFMLMPAYADVLRIQAIEFNDQIRRSAFSFELINNKLKIFPIPSFDNNLFFTYIKMSDRSSLTRNGDPKNLVTNVSNVPYTSITYSTINGPGRRWIFEYGLAVCKEILGNIRSKYSTIPIPGNETTLNGPALVDQAKNEQDKLIEKLRTHLEVTSRKSQMEMKAAEAAAMSSTFTMFPMTIFIG